MARDDVVAAMRLQAEWCRMLGSPLYQAMLDRAADDLAAGGAVDAVVGDWPGDPAADAVALRFLGAIHRAVLDGQAPALAAHYPSAGGTPAFPAAWEALRAYVAANVARLRAAVAAGPPQTNEVQRSAVLLAGFHRVASWSGLPLRLLEIGASAGLNLHWDRYRHELGSHRWGPAGAPVVLRVAWHGPAPSLAASIRIASRAGCDLAPLDPADRDTALRLAAFVWPDQSARLAQLRAALAVAAADRVRVEAASADAWLAAALSRPADGVATVVYHSIVWQYLPAAVQADIVATLERAGAAAAPVAPLAWLRLELGASGFELRLTRWPDGEETLLGRAQPHGREVWWAEAGAAGAGPRCE
ncbi:MAG: DUF2332 family protein [Candidatus Binatia bacterium]